MTLSLRDGCTKDVEQGEPALAVRVASSAHSAPGLALYASSPCYPRIPSIDDSVAESRGKMATKSTKTNRAKAATTRRKTTKAATVTSGPDSAIATQDFATAEDLLAALSPMASTWNPSPTLWAFRGQADAAWPLLPAALRHNARLDYLPTGSSGLKRTNEEQVRAEFDRLIDFFLAADAQGLGIPEDTQDLRSPESWMETIEFDVCAAMQGGRWPSDRLLSLSALAQHYGVPTRLVDWSNKPLIATYFAAEEAARWVKESKSFPNGNEKGTHALGVWCLNLDFVINAWPANDESYPRILVVTAPRATNPNLHAQGGVFTIERNEFNPEDTVTSVPLDEIIEAKWIELGETKPAMRLLRLPHSEAPALLRLLRWHGVDGGVVYPGYKGVVKALEERRLWDRAQPISPFESRRR